ncbi:MAG: GlsB/YeaQ/YmgE family stress response membrane protein [Gemmatimonadaceae bacterium]
MDSQGLIWFLVIGLIAGFLAGKLTKGGGFGVVGDIVIGVLGAFLGGWVFGLLGIATNGLLGSIVCATIGAILLLFLVRLIKRA